MESVSNYLKKHDFRPEILEQPHPALHICIVIPCFNEPCLIPSLESLWNCTRPSCAAEIIIVVNSPENCSQEITDRNLSTIRETNIWIEKHMDPKLRFHILYHPQLPTKFAGVGLARRIGMDQAVYRLSLLSHMQGIIAGFDADAVCDPNYLTAIENHFRLHPKSPGAYVYFEHPVGNGNNENNEGNEDNEGNENNERNEDNERNEGIVLYELHLRYLNQALRYAGHPHAFHTVGSSFAVRADAYVKQGGMNKRQAGEDFYFLQKIISLGNYTEINTTRIIPSPRQSNRVPFGTGASMRQWNSEQYIKTYNFGTFENLRKFIGLAPLFYKAPANELASFIHSLAPSLQEYLQTIDFDKELESIIANSASPQTFLKRFFHWFNAFMVIKYLNISQNTSRTEVYKEACHLAEKLKLTTTNTTPSDLLNLYRGLDRNGVGLNPQ